MKIYLFKTLLLLCALMAGSGSVWAENVVVTWNIKGVSSSANNQQVNTALTTSSISPSGASGTWTALSNGSSSYAASNSGAQLGASSNREFNGTITLSNTSIPSTATIKSVSVTAISNGSSTLSATVNNNSLGDSKTISGSTETAYTISGSQTGNSIVLTLSNTTASKYVKITKIVVTYEEQSFTISAQSCNDSYGHVSLTNNTITATPEEGYRVSLTTPYTITPDNSATVTQNGNVFTVTPSANTTITINFEAIPPHKLETSVNNSQYGSVSDGGYILEGATTTLTATPNDGYRFVNWSVTGEGSSVEDASANPTTFTMGTEDATVTANFEAIPSHTLSSAVTPANSGSVELGSSSVREGLTTTAEATPEDGYIFKYWSIEGTGASITNTTANPVTVTMGTANATITAHFAAVYTITWSVNGQVVKTMENAEEGTDLSTQFPEVADFGGKIFRGWVTTSTVAADFDESGFVNTSTATATSNPNYYAVFATGSGVASETATLTAPDNGSSSYENQTFTDDKGKSWSGNVSVSTQDNKRCIQMRTSSSALTSPTFPGTITEIKMLARNGSTKEARSFNFNSSATNNNGDLGTLEVPAEHKYNSELAATLTGTFNQFYLWVTNNLGFNYIKVTYNTVSYSDYTTSVTVPVTITSAQYATFHSDYAVNFTGTGITAYTAEDGESSVKLNEITSGQVPAKTPVVLYKAGADGTAIDVPVIASAEAITGDNDLHVVGADGLTGAEGVYVLAKPENMEVGFYLWDSSVTLNAGKVYLKYIAPGQGDARLFLPFSSDAQGISATLNNNETMNNVVFDLQGRRVAKPAKGLYIMNGRKVMVK